MSVMSLSGCKKCGKTVPARSGASGPQASYCSYGCKRAVWTENAREKRRNARLTAWSCAHCGGPWQRESIRGGAKFCSDTCMNTAARLRVKAKPKPCVTCGEPFEAKSAHLYCSSLCRPRRDYSDTNGSTHRRRCERWGLEYDQSITRAGVAARDGWGCGLCGRPIDPKLSHPDLWSASIDHRIPLSAGSAGHTWENVQLAHLECNLKKGDRH